MNDNAYSSSLSFHDSNSSSTVKLSVIIIVRNEAKQLRNCLSSVCWADEIIVLDSGSTDGTQAIAQEYTNQFYETDWPGFGPQKNRALAHATGDWVLSIDADEQVSATLRAEIEEAVMVTTKYHGYWIPRRSNFCGRWIRYGDWRRDEVIRLFRRGYARFSDDPVHERVIVQGPIGKLHSPLFHYSIKNLAHALEKVNHYSSAGAQRLRKRTRQPGPSAALGHGLWAFLRSYILRLGFLDGKEGFYLAVSAAEVTFYRYAKANYPIGDERPLPPEPPIPCLSEMESK
ncbi:Uncharacterized glycosyltransferase HI_0653 [Gammaproteobacteria bacterium]